jgi:hypothetical protein
MNRRPTIADYMARSLVTLPPDMEINRAMVILLDTRISGAPVLNPAGVFVGVLSKKDCLRAALNSSYHREWGGLVADYMTRPRLGSGGRALPRQPLSPIPGHDRRPPRRPDQPRRCSSRTGGALEWRG